MIHRLYTFKPRCKHFGFKYFAYIKCLQQAVWSSKMVSAFVWSVLLDKLVKLLQRTQTMCDALSRQRLPNF